MLYQIYETQRSVMEPFADFALAASRLYGNPGLPIQKTLFAQRMSAGYELLYRLAKDYEKPQFNINTVEVEGVEVAIHERIELDKPFCELRRFKRFSDDPDTLTKLKGQPVVLVVAPLSGHYATLLRDTVRTMLQGHKVYITDWKNARLVPLSDGEFHLDDYVNYVEEFVRHLQGKYGNCHVMSVCQPTVPVLAAVSLMASRGEKTPLSMTMMGGPIDARKSPTSVNDLAVDKGYQWFENNVIYAVPDSFPGRGRRVYPGFLQHTGFLAMNPDRHSANHYDFFKNLIKGDDTSTEAHKAFYDEYNAVLDMDADYYLETIETVFQKYKLVNGTWDVRSPSGELERVRPQDIRTGAMLTVEGELDDISGSGQTRAAHALCTGLPGKEQEHYEVKGAGHYGIFSGRRWRDLVYPQVRDFIAKHDASDSASDSAGNAVEGAASRKAQRTPMAADAVATLPGISRTPAQTAQKPKRAALTAKQRAASTAANASKSVAAPKVPARAPADKAMASTKRKSKAAKVPSAKAGAPTTRWVDKATAAADPVRSEEPATSKATVVTAAPPSAVRRPASRRKT